MTEPRTPARNPLRHPRAGYPTPTDVPQAPRRRPAEERAALAASSRTAAQLAVLAIVIAGVALGLGIWRAVAATGSGCQATAWSAEPDPNRLPSGWTMKGTTFDANRRSTTFAAPAGDGSTPVPNVLATVTCIPDGAADALSRAAAAAREIGGSGAVTAKDDLSDGGFETTDDSGAIFLEFRRGDILVDLIASGGGTVTDIETLASAYDRALGGDGGTIASPAPTSSVDTGLGSPGPSGDSGVSHNVPELEKLLPAKVGSVQLDVASDLGGVALSGGDQASRSAIAALAAQGKKPDDFRIAQSQGFDSSGNPLIVLSAMSVTGLDAVKVRSVAQDFFGLTTSAIKQNAITLSGKAWTKYDLGDGGPIYYLRTEGQNVFAITTSDASLAEQAAAALP